MFWKKKAGGDEVAEKCGQALFQVLVEGLKVDGRVRAEDVITAAASIVGEACIAAAGDFNPRQHAFVPGARVFSDKVNQLFCGDAPDGTVDTAPANSVVGLLRDRILAGGYARADFATLKVIFEHFAANLGKPSDWGTVPLAVPEEHLPSILPLRVAYETRQAVDRVFQPLNTADARLRAAVFALARVLIAVREVIDNKVAVLLALQIVNGMAKTAPMTDEAMRKAQK